MAHLTRRSMLRGSLVLAAAKTVAFPHVVKAAATTATMWFSQGFVQDEDVVLRNILTDHEQASGTKTELTISPSPRHRQKIIPAITIAFVASDMHYEPNEIVT